MTDLRPQLRAMPSSLNDACRTMEVAAKQIDALVKALEEVAALDRHYYTDSTEKYDGYLAKIARKALLAVVGGASRQGERS